MTLSDAEFLKAAKTLGVAVAAIKAVFEVEAAGNGFLKDGRPKIQYEPHVMRRRLTARFGQERADKARASYPDLVALKPGSYNALTQEWADMERAGRLIDRLCALESASWGAPQIMGYHWEALGYASIDAFVEAMQTHAGQLDAFVRFIKADHRLVTALRQKDWDRFARLYNGPAYARNNYHTKMAAAFKRHGGVA